MAPVKDTAPKLNTETPGHTKETLSKESEQIQQRKDRPVVMSLEGERESPSIQMKGEDYTSQSGAKPSTSDPHVVQHDGASRVLDKNTASSNVVQGIPVAYDKDAPEHIAESISSTSSIPPGKPSMSHATSTEKGNIPIEKQSAPHIPKEKPSASHITVEEPSAPHIPTEKPSTPHILVEELNAPHIPREKPSASHILVEEPSAPHIPTEKQVTPQVPAEKPSAPHITTEKPSAPHIPMEKLSEPQIPAEQSSVPHAPVEKLSSSNSEVPLTIKPKAASQPAHGSDLTEDKLGFSKVTEMPHSEYSESIDVKPFVSQASSKEPVGGTKQDSYVYQQQNKVEESQKAQAPDSATQSAGKVPKEASVLDDKSELKLSETVDTASRTSASKQKKVMYCLTFLQSVL